jgi:hypothetical protein
MHQISESVIADKAIAKHCQLRRPKTLEPLLMSILRSVVGGSTKNDTLFVRPWDGFKSLAHAFAVARELEKRFGPIRDIRIGRVSLLESFYNHER